MNQHFYCVVPAAGIGSRMQAAHAKQYLPLAQGTVLDAVLSRLTTYPAFKKIVVAVAREDAQWSQTRWADDPLIQTAWGGATRAQSVLHALKALENVAQANDWVLVHDAARPCITHQDMAHLIAAVQHHAVGGVLGAPVRDTLKNTDATAHVVQTVDRELLWHAFTPQMFRFKVLLDALQTGLSEGRVITDEASAVEQVGLRPQMIIGRLDNIKITYPEDLLLAQFYLQQQKQAGI